LRSLGALVVVVLLAWPAVAHANPDVVAAIREALSLAVERSIATVGHPDGFCGNPSIRIPVPEQLNKAEARLRYVGQERVVERFEATMNYAAEYAAPAARPALLSAVNDLPLDDGRRVLAGGETAATDALRRHALGRVIAALTPAAAQATERVGAARRYKRFLKDAQFGGLVNVPPVDLDAYVVTRTADGIFHAIGQEERRIRLDPTARPSPLVRQVFGR